MSAQEPSIAVANQRRVPRDQRLDYQQAMEVRHRALGIWSRTFSSALMFGRRDQVANIWIDEEIQRPPEPPAINLEQLQEVARLFNVSMSRWKGSDVQ